MPDPVYAECLDRLTEGQSVDQREEREGLGDWLPLGSSGNIPEVGRGSGLWLHDSTSAHSLEHLEWVDFDM